MLKTSASSQMEPGILNLHGNKLTNPKSYDFNKTDKWCGLTISYQNDDSCFFLGYIYRTLMVGPEQVYVAGLFLQKDKGVLMCGRFWGGFICCRASMRIVFCFQSANQQTGVMFLENG